MRSGKNTTAKMVFAGSSAIVASRGSIGSHPSCQDVGDAEGIGLDGQRRISAAGGGHEAAISDIEVVERPGAAVGIEHRIGLVGAEARPSQNVVGAARQLVFAEHGAGAELVDAATFHQNMSA